MGAYAAFYDLAAGCSGPLLGLAAGAFGFAAVFLLSTLSVAASALVAVHLLRTARCAVASQRWPSR